MVFARLGIMKSRINKGDSLSLLSKAALRAGFDELIVFTPQDVHLPSQTINAYQWTQKGWVQNKKSPFPFIIYDIGYYHSDKEYSQNLGLQKNSKVPFVGYCLGNKIKIYNILSKSQQLRSYLIPTHRVKGTGHFFRCLQHYLSVILKPANTWGGKGILKVVKKNNHYLIHEKNRQNAMSHDQLSNVVKKRIKTGTHVLQPWVNIRSSKGNVADHRVLIQKNKFGQWTIRGIATRIGASGYIISNLKRGGRAVKTLPYLKKEFGRERSAAMYQTLQQLSHDICIFLEKFEKKRFVEFGIDFAIDRRGDIKIIEVNVKPGRKILETTGTKEIRRETFLAPFYYARSILDKKTP